MNNNPLLQLDSKKLPQFAEVKPEQIEPALDKILHENKTAIAQLLKQPQHTWQNLMQVLEDLDDRLSYFWSVVSHLNAVVNSPELRAVYKACLPKISEYSTQISQNSELLAAIKSLREEPYFSQLDTVQKKIIREELRDFHLSGVDLPPAEKQRFAELEKKLSQLMNKFEENLLDATQGWSKLITDPTELSGIPKTAVQAALENAQQKNLKGWLFNLEAPSYIAIITYADSQRLREEFYTAYVTRASDQGPDAGRFDNTSVMLEILQTRLAMAQLLEFKNYAEVSLATKTAKNTQQVVDFLEQLINYAKPIAQTEFAELTDFAKKQLSMSSLSAWDISYVSEKLSQHKYAISEEELRPYFPENQVLQGLFEIVKRLFDVTVKEKTNVETWHKDVRFFEIYNAQQNLIGQFYLDLYARENKRGGAWMEECRARRQLANGEIQKPIAFLTCNFSRPVGDAPALFTHEDVLTLFHEFGHGLNQLLSQVIYASASGTSNVPWDVVEFPSQFLENWCWQKPALDLIAKHYQTGEKLPNELITKLQRTRNYHAGMQTLRQLEFSLFDFLLHLEFDPSQVNQVQQTLDAVRAKLKLYPIPEFNRFQHGFSHIFASGYGAGYYSYKWAEVWASDAFSQFEKKGIFDKETGMAFLNKILSKGSSEEPLQMFIAFQGREPKMDALLQHMCGSTAQETIAGDPGVSRG